MINNDLQHFQTLKQKLQQTLQASYPHFAQPITAWKAQEITALQEALHQKVKGYISEKWFYTHLKPTENTKLPRIDMLDMLAQYAGYKGWQDFLFQESPPPVAPNSKEKDKRHITKKNEQLFSLKYNFYIIIALVLMVGVALWAMNSKTFKIAFCFQDADTQQNITKDIEITVLKKGESPQTKKVNAKGCVELSTVQNKLTFVVKAKYYKTDTIVRTLDSGQASEIIKLKRDDYALLIRLISQESTTEAAQAQKRKQLEKMLDTEAQIFQIDEAGLGIELYSKEDFINKLSLPLSSLKNLEIIETQYEKGKIILLRFMQK